MISNSHRFALLSALVLAAAAAAPAQGPAARETGSDSIRIPFEAYTLPNGLNVILSVDRSTPTVAVNAWYHVGSKNEAQGRTGFAHLFEHVMFTGSGHIPYGLHDKLTEGVGGSNNGTTSNDRTTYFETVPSNYLETALWLESDRMGFLLDSLDIAKLNAQRDIVKNERRQGVDNQPYGRAGEILSAATYPKSHPYSWSVIGSMEDLSAASEQDVKDFFRLYYAPNNAYLAVVGDFDPAQAKAWVTKYFGDLPKGRSITRPSVKPVTLEAEKRLVYEDRVQVPRLYVQWPTVGVRHDDRYALEVLGSILSGPRTARLTKALVYDKQAASAVSARQGSSEDVGELLLTITPRPGNTLTDLEQSAEAIIETFKAEGPTAEEIEKATAGEELSFIRGLESNLGKSMRLATGAGFHGDPGYFREEYEKTLSVSAEDVKRVANKYLTRGRVVLSIVPMGKVDLAAKPAESTKVTGEGAAQQALDRTMAPTPGATPDLRVPAWTKTRLSNGADLIVSEKHDLPLVSFSLTLLGGANQFEPADRTGLASITASMMSEGTTSRDGEALSNALQLLGTSISAGVGDESGSMSFVSSTGRFNQTLAILADMLVNPVFPVAALERIRGQRLVALTQGRARPATIASRVFPRVLYGTGHPYGWFTTEESLEAVTRDDVIAFHRAYFQPGRALITVVGDVKAADVKPATEKAFADWRRGGERPGFQYPAVSERGKTAIYLVDKPGAAQSTVTIGHPGPPRSTPDYYALQVMNTMLGGMFQSRLNANIREEKGYSYGVGSGFDYGKGPGAFSADGDIVSDKTDEALVEFMKELRGILGSRPVTDDELRTAKQSLIQRLPTAFGSVAGINNALTTIWTQGLPDDYYQQYAAAVAAVTKDDVLRVAKKYIYLDRLAIVIVGDRASIEAPLKATGIAPITILDIEGRPQGAM